MASCFLGYGEGEHKRYNGAEIAAVVMFQVTNVPYKSISVQNIF